MPPRQPALMLPLLALLLAPALAARSDTVDAHGNDRDAAAVEPQMPLLTLVEPVRGEVVVRPLTPADGDNAIDVDAPDGSKDAPPDADAASLAAAKARMRVWQLEAERAKAARRTMQTFLYSSKRPRGEAVPEAAPVLVSFERSSNPFPAMAPPTGELFVIGEPHVHAVMSEMAVCGSCGGGEDAVDVLDTSDALPLPAPPPSPSGLFGLLMAVARAMRLAFEGHGPASPTAAPSTTSETPTAATDAPAAEGDSPEDAARARPRREASEEQRKVAFAYKPQKRKELPVVEWVAYDKFGRVVKRKPVVSAKAQALEGEKAPVPAKAKKYNKKSKLEAALEEMLQAEQSGRRVARSPGRPRDRPVVSELSELSDYDMYDSSNLATPLRPPPRWRRSLEDNLVFKGPYVKALAEAYAEALAARAAGKRGGRGRARGSSGAVPGRASAGEKPLPKVEKQPGLAENGDAYFEDKVMGRQAGPPPAMPPPDIPLN